MSQLLKEDPKKVAQLLAYAATFPDFPKDFAPPGLTDPNYVPPNKSKPLLIYCYFMIGFTTLIVILRLWIRRRVKGMGFGWDDYLIVPGQLLTLALIVVMILLMRVGGAGMHVYDLAFARIEKTQLLQFVGIQTYMTAILFIRLSITALLYRLIGASSKIKRWLLHITAITLVAQWVVQILAFILATKPISAAWDLDVRLSGFKKTVNLPLEVLILTIFYLLMDVWLLVLPIHTIWSLQLPLRTRISVTWVFVFGGVACAGAVVKTVYIYPVLDSYDSTWNGCGFIAGALTEVGFGIISSSMPALNHIIVKVLPRTIESWLSSTLYSKWFSSGSGKPQSSKSVQSAKSEVAEFNEWDNDNKFTKVITLQTTRIVDEPPSHFARDPDVPRNFSRNFPLRNIHADEPVGHAIYLPSWIGIRHGESGEDLESNSQEYMTSLETNSAVARPDGSTEDIGSKSWLNLR